MAVDIEALTMPEFLMMLAWEGDPPPDPAFDNIRMSRHDWETMFPPTKPAQPEETDAEDPTPAPPAQRPAAPGGPQ